MKFAVLDLETTELDAEVGGIVEFGLAVVDKPIPEEMGTVTFMYNHFNDPGVPITEEASRVNGITDEMVKGTSLHVDLLKEQMEGVDYVVAHNAPFDYTFSSVDEQTSWLCDIPWLCSWRHIDWEARGHSASLSLMVLAAEHGFINPFPHRALPDGLTTLKLVDWPYGEPRLEEMRQTAEQKIVRIDVYNTHFSQKDAINAITKFRWVPNSATEQKHWTVELSEGKAREVFKRLRDEVYGSAKRADNNIRYHILTWSEYLDQYKTVKY